MLLLHLSFAHDLLTTFLIRQGFDVTPHYILKTAFKASFTSLADIAVEPLKKAGSFWKKIAGKDDKKKGLGRKKDKLPHIMFQAEYDALPVGPILC